jgi:hypothetical protein
MKMLRAMLRITFAICTATIAAVIAFSLVQFGAQLLDLTYPGAPIWSEIIAVLLSVAALISAGVYTARRLWPENQSEARSWANVKKIFLVTILAGYFLTWVFGVPAVQTNISEFSINQYKRIHSNDGIRISDGYPRIRILASFPLLPGLTAVCHEYQLANVNGWGGWDVHVWYMVGVKRLFSLPSWVS